MSTIPPIQTTDTFRNWMEIINIVIDRINTNSVNGSVTGSPNTLVLGDPSGKIDESWLP